jgi:hypothetical protein
LGLAGIHLSPAHLAASEGHATFRA